MARIKQNKLDQIKGYNEYKARRDGKDEEEKSSSASSSGSTAASKSDTSTTSAKGPTIKQSKLDQIKGYNEYKAKQQQKETVEATTQRPYKSPVASTFRTLSNAASGNKTLSGTTLPASSLLDSALEKQQTSRNNERIAELQKEREYISAELDKAKMGRNYGLMNSYTYELGDIDRELDELQNGTDYATHLQKQREQANAKLEEARKAVNDYTTQHGGSLINPGNTADPEVLKGLYQTLSDAYKEQERIDELIRTTDPEYKSGLDRIGYGLGGIGMSLAATVPLIGETAVQAVENLITGKDEAVDEDSLGMRWMAKANELRQEATEGMSGVGAFLGDTAISIGQNLATLPTGFINPAIPLVAMGAQAGAQKAYEVQSEGNDAGEALLRGAASGVIEGITEKIPLDNLFDLVKTGGKGLLKNLLKQSGVEATEEGLSYAMNYIADKAAGDPNAKFSVQEMLESAASGGVSGLFFGGMGTAANNIYYSKVGTDYQDAAQDVVNEGLTFAPETEAYQTAQELQKKLEAGKTLSRADVGRAVVENEQAIRAEETAQQAKEPETAEKAAAEPVETLEDAAREVVAREMGMAQESSLVGQQRSEAANVKSDTAEKTVLGETGKKVLAEIAQESGQSTDAVHKAFDAAYLAGRTNLPRNKTVLQNEVQEKAYDAGRRDFILAADEKTLAEQGKTEYTGIVNEIATEGLNYGTAEEVYLRNGSQRAGSAYPGGSVSGLEKSAGRNQSWAPQGESADVGTASLSYGEAVSTASLGISGGSHDNTIRLVTGGDTVHTRQARQVAKERGLRLVMFSGDNLQITQKDGSVASVRALIVGDRMFVRVDHPKYTSDQLTRHEAGHDMIAKGEIDPDTVRKRIDQSFGKQKAGQLADNYVSAYEGSGLTPQEIWEEVICDSLGDMNIFSGTVVEKQAKELLRETKAASADTKTESTRGPPQGKASRDLPIYETAQTRKPIQATNFAEDKARRAAAVEKYGLDKVEASRLGNYVGGSLCYMLNTRMMSGKLTDGERGIIASMESALRKFPEYSGRVYRNLQFRTEEQYNAFLAEYAKGETVTLKAFTSTSKNPNGYPLFGGGVVHLVVDAQHGCDIADTFGLPRQQEVILLPGTELKITRVTTANDGNPLIIAQEVAANEIAAADEKRDFGNQRPARGVHQAGDSRGSSAGRSREDHGRVHGEVRRNARGDGVYGNRGAGTDAGRVSEKNTVTGKFSRELDMEYMKAVNAGDMKTVRRMVADAAKAAGFNNAIPEQTLAYTTRTGKAPTKTVKVYKVFTVAPDGSPTALFVSGTEKLPQNVWLDAQDTWHFTAENGNEYIPSTQNPYTDGGKTGASVKIPNEEVRRELIARGFLPEGSKAKSVTALAYRPGWHAGDMPFFPQGGMKREGSNYENIHRYNQVVFECELDADRDYTEYARSQAKALTKKGTVNEARADLQEMPTGGYYRYSTNPLTKGGKRGTWFIGGSLKIGRALTQEECDAILTENGYLPQEWEQGKMDLSSLGYTGEQQDAARKTLAPITYDDNGDVIPLSQRFDPNKSDVRFSMELPVEQTDEWQASVNQSMTMAQAKDMVQRAFVLGGIKDWYEGEYKNGDEWLRDRGVDDVAMIIDNEWQLQEKYLNKIQGLMDEEFMTTDILEAYLAGTLTGKVESTKPKRLNVAEGSSALDSRFYAPHQIENAKAAYETALQKVTNKNRDAVYKARADVIMFAHTRGAAEALGLTQSELNKKLSQWARYNARAKETSQRFNAGVADWNKWTGIENSNILTRMTVSKDDLDRLVGEITGDSDGFQRSYIMRTMLALDTHIDYSGLNFEFVRQPDSKKSSVNGQYLDSARTIRVKYNAPHTVAHEMGHFLDYQWARDIGVGGALTDGFDRDRLADPDVKQWAANFDKFKDSITDVSDIHSGYSMDAKEVFARFVDKFVQWVNYTANGEQARGTYYYNDKFTAQHYIEFVRLLQEKSMLDGKKQEGAKFSRDLESIEQMRRQNDKLRQVSSALREQFQVTKFARVDRKALERFTKQLMKDYGSQADIEDVRDLLDGLYTYMANGIGGEQASWNDAFQMAKEVAEDVLRNAVTVDDELYQMYKPLRDHIRSTRITMSPEERGNLSDYGGYNEFRKANMGTLRLTNDGLPVDTFYQELAEMYPGLFDAEEYSDQAAQLTHIVEVLDGLRPLEVNPYSNQMQEMTEWLANDIMDRFLKLPQAQPTVADRLGGKVPKGITAGLEQMDTLLDEQAAAIEQQGSELKQAQQDARRAQAEASNARAEADYLRNSRSAMEAEKNAEIQKLIEQNREKIKQVRDKEKAKRKEAVKKAKEQAKKLRQQTGKTVAPDGSLEYGELLKAYGEIEKGENPYRDVKVPRKTGDNQNVSKTIRTVLEAKATPDEAVPTIQKLIEAGEFSFESIKDEAAVDQAEKTIRSKGFNVALRDWIADVSAGKVSKANTAMGWALYNAAANAGDTKAAMDILSSMVQHQRSAAQALQATRILKKMSPDAQLYNVQKTVDSINKELQEKREKKGGKKRKATGENIPVEEWMQKVGEMLAEQLGESVKQKSRKEKTVSMRILADLRKLAQETVTPAAMPAGTRTEMDAIYDMFNNREHYEKALAAAKETVAKEYGNNPEIMEALDKWMQTAFDYTSKLSQELLGQSDIRIPQELADKFLSQTDQAGRDKVAAEIYRYVGSQLPSTFLDKWNAWRYLAMLGNPRTHVRNVLGNAFFAPVVATKNLTATAIEGAVSFVTRGKINRTKGRLDSKLLKAAWADYANVADEITAGGKYSDSAMKNQHIQEGRTIFKFKPLEGARKGNSAALEMEDMWFARPHYAAALAQYCKANGVTVEQLQKGKALGNARAHAIKEAQKATYRDTNAFSDFVGKLGRYHGDNKVAKAASVAMEGILPFRKTPANILVRGIEYSPIGLAKSLTFDLARVKKGDITAADLIDNISAGLTGTGLLGLGVWLAAEGLVRGAGGSDDEEKEYDELQGHQSYALELPDGTSITLDWLAPEVLPFFVGVNLYEQAKENKDKTNLADFLTAVSNVTEPMLEMSCLQSLNDVLDSVGYASSGDGLSALPAVLVSAATSYLTQGIPTLLGQAERSSQDVRVSTYTSKNNFLTSDLQYTLGKASAKIPGWDFNQIPYIDAWGRTESSGSTGENIANNFLNPAYMSKVQTSDMEAELQRLYDQTGESGLFPARADKYFTVDGERKDLSGEEFVEYATEKGQRAYDLLSDLTGRREYDDLSDAEKVEAVKLAYTYTNATAKDAVSDYELEGWAATAQEANKAGVDVTDYILYKVALSMEDKRNTSGTVGSYGNDEKAKAINSMSGLSDKDIAYLWNDDNGQALKMYNAGVDMHDYVDFKAGLAKLGDGTPTKAEVADVIYGLNASYEDAWAMLSTTQSGKSKSAQGAYKHGIPAELYLEATLEMENIKAPDGKTETRRKMIESYLYSVCDNTKEWLYLLGTEYDSVKDDADYIAYFGKE